MDGSTPGSDRSQCSRWSIFHILIARLVAGPYPKISGSWVGKRTVLPYFKILQNISVRVLK